MRLYEVLKPAAKKIKIGQVEQTQPGVLNIRNLALKQSFCCESVKSRKGGDVWGGLYGFAVCCQGKR
jgi:hypothetical protein